MKRRSLALIAALALAACGGGGGGSSPVTPTAPTAPSGPTNNAQSAPASITIHIPIPSHSTGTVRRPQYVSPSTSTLQVVINTVNGSSTLPSWVTATTNTALTVGTNCTASGGTETCTVPVQAPVGSVNYTFNATDGTNVLSTATADESIVQGTSNALSATLEGVVYTVSVVPAATPDPTATAPRSNPIATTVSAFDADGNLIVDPGAYANPFTLTDPETTTSGATSLSDTEGSGATVNVTSPDDAVTLEYNAGAINSFAVTAGGSIPGGGTVSCTVCDVTVATPGDIVFTGTTDDTAPNGGLSSDANWGQQTVYFSQASGTQDISASERAFTGGFGGAFAISLDPLTCNGVATASGSGTNFSVTATGVGVCEAQLTEASTNFSAASGPNGYPLTNPGHPASVSGNETENGTFWISVTSSSFGIDSHGRRPPQ